MRIGIYSSVYPGLNGTGGIAVYTKSLALGLVELGHEPHVLVCGDPNELGAQREIDGVQIHVTQPSYAKVISRWLRGGRETAQIGWAALQIARRHGLDVFEFPNFEGYAAAYAHLAPRLAPPLVMRLHTSTAECLAIEGRPLTIADRFDVWREVHGCMNAESLYVSTNAHRRHMAGELGIPEARMQIISLGVPDGTAPALRVPRPRRTPPTVVYVGRLEPRKGTLDVFNAIPAVLKVVPDCRFVFVGNDRPLAPGDITYETWLDQNLPEVRSSVEFRGFVDDATRQAIVEDADVFVAPSLYESFGLIFVEAMRVAVPAIGTTAGGIPEVIEDGKSGILVPPQSPPDVANAIIELLTNEEKRLRIAAGGRKRFDERFSSKAMATRTIEHHQALLDRKR